MNALLSLRLEKSFGTLIDREAAEGTELSTPIVGVERRARVIAPSSYDPLGRAVRI